MPSDSPETTQPMTLEDAAALAGAPKVAALPGAAHRWQARAAQWWSAGRAGVEPWMVAVSIAGLLAGAITGYWLKKI